MAGVNRLFDPKSVALIGATDREGSVGATILENLLLGKDSRAIYPVNPKRDSVKGLKCYSHIGDIPEQVDMAVIVTPAATVPSVFEECCRAGVGGVTIISAGFQEIGDEGKRLEAEIKRLQQEYGVRVLGPNCVGFIRPSSDINASFLTDQPEAGHIAFVSQSGALGTAILDWAVSTNVGFSLFVSLGSMLDVDYGDVIDYLGEDPQTRSILIYMESVGQAKKFMSAARGFARTKPIIVIKAGKHGAGAKAAQSHTGALVGDFEVYDAAFKRAGVVSVAEIEDLFGCASALRSRLPKGPRLAIVTNAGGPGVMAADAIVDQGLELAQLTDQSIEALNAELPHYWSHGNPVDILGDAGQEAYETAVKTCLRDPNVDGLIVVYTPQGAASSTELASTIVTLVETIRHKPVLTVWMGEQSVREARDLFNEKDISTHPTPESAVKTYMYMYRYRRNLELLYETPEELPVDLSPPRTHLKLLVRRAVREGRTLLDLEDVGRFLDAYGIPRAQGSLAGDANQAATTFNGLRGPVALKIASQDIVHKSDIGGVVLGVDSADQASEEFQRLVDRASAADPDARIDGVYVQKMLPGVDYELILGGKKDPDFGAVILFGLGGTAVELFRDVSLGLPPLNQVLARRLAEDTVVYKALSQGLRNVAPIDLRALEETMVNFSNMLVDFPEIAEIDLNPLAISEGKPCVLDARIILDPAALDQTKPYPHLVIIPYPTKYVVPWRMDDGTDVIIRPIRPEDEPMELELIRGLSEESSRNRFFQVIKDLPHDALVRFCNIDYDREMALIAEAKEDGRRVEIAVARIITDPGENRAEFAIVLADRHQGKGLGTKLLDMLIHVADEKGLESIYGIILPENKAMIRLCKKLGFTTRRTPDGILAELRLR